MRFDLITIFPGMFDGPLALGVVGRACDRGLVEVRVHDLRDFADPPHRHVDDAPYGGGAGMVFRVEPIARALAAVRVAGASTAIVLPSPRGEMLTQGLTRELHEYEQVVVVCDRYEGSDERVRGLVTHEVSLGDYVLTGGELCALVLVDAVARCIPGVVGDAASVERDSFASGLLDHGQYTRPPEHASGTVPTVVASGDHARIGRFRSRDAVRRTLERRPDLLEEACLDASVRGLVEQEREARNTLPGSGREDRSIGA